MLHHGIGRGVPDDPGPQVPALTESESSSKSSSESSSESEDHGNDDGSTTQSIRSSTSNTSRW